MAMFCLLLLALVSASVIESQSSKKSPFWLTAELVSVEWKLGCLTTAYCSSPRLIITEHSEITKECFTVSWTITEHIVQDNARPFTTYWPNDDPKNIAVGCEVSGIDPKYGFQRVCDRTPNTAAASYSYETAESAKLIVELKGRCFNATLTVQTHHSRSPWCPQSQTPPPTIQAMKTAAPVTQFIRSSHSDEDGISVTAYLALVTIVAMLSIFAFGAAIVIYARYHGNTLNRDNENTVVTSSTTKVQSVVTTKDEQSYEVPWDHKYDCLTGSIHSAIATSANSYKIDAADVIAGSRYPRLPNRKFCNIVSGHLIHPELKVSPTRSDADSGVSFRELINI